MKSSSTPQGPRSAPGARSWLHVRLECSDKRDNLADLIVAEGAPEGRHAARFAVLDAVENLLVSELSAHQLRSLPGFAPVVLVAEAADVAECILDAEVRCAGARLRLRRRRGRLVVGGEHALRDHHRKSTACGN